MIDDYMYACVDHDYYIQIIYYERVCEFFFMNNTLIQSQEWKVEGLANQFLKYTLNSPAEGTSKL